MAYVKRVEFAGAIFHLWSRRVDRWRLFVDEEDWRRYVALLEEVAHDFEWEVIEFCLMPNHVHLLIQIKEPNIGRGMQRLHSIYVRAFNRKHGRTGHLFERRPQWKAVTDEIYFATVRQYIAENPVRAKLCQRAEDWTPSSRGLAAERRRWNLKAEPPRSRL